MKRLAVILMVLVVATFSNAFAHKISAFTDLEGNKLSIVSYFSDGTPAKHAQVIIYDEKTGKKVITGYTDEEGNYSCTLPHPGKYKVVVNAELGHRAVAEVNYGPVGQAEESSASAGSGASENVSKEAAASTNAPVAGVSAEEIRKIVREELKAQLQPIDRKLLKIEEQVAAIHLKDVFGGLGWIIGIFGAAAFGYSFRRKED